MKLASSIDESKPQKSNVRKPFRATPQQEAIFAALENDPANLMVVARAGTGKSSTARESMWRILESNRRASIRYTCFNKAIADEFAALSPSQVDVGTMHSFGFSALKMSKERTIEKGKSYGILDYLDYKHERPWIRKTAVAIVSHAKNAGLHPESPRLARELYQLASRFDLCPYGKDEDWCIALAKEVLIESANETSTIDFDDMLWLPSITDCLMPSCDYLVIDEAQDLSPVQHTLAARLNPDGVTVIIGDDRQAIYGWRGADHYSMDTLGSMLEADPLPLTISWRCPKSHVRLAKKFVHDFEHAPGASEGEIFDIHLNPAVAIGQARAGDLVLCRTNAPLIRGAIGLVTELRRAVVRGRAIGEQLASVAHKIDALTIRDFLKGVSAWSHREISRLSLREGTETAIEAIRDREGCLCAIAEACSSPSEIPNAITTLFSDSGKCDQVIFSTVHRAKGSEADRVMYLSIPYSKERDKRKPPQEWELQQRKNLTYVAVTRSKQTLTIVYPE